jgi:glucose/arabinose dehydrogenase
MRPIAALAAILLLASISTTSAIESEEHDFAVVTLARGLAHPWGLAFLPDGDLLVTERPGRLRVVRGGEHLEREPIVGTPPVNNRRQGGLLDVALHPDFAVNRLVYLSYSADGDGGVGTEVARGRLVERQLLDVEVIFRARPKTPGSLHYGSRLLFAADGTLYVTLGDRYHAMDRAQDPTDHLGTVVRLQPDGSIPPDNPFAAGEAGAPEVYSYGHRNVQGIAQRPADGAIWIHEHGPKGGDEVNILRPGANYGWPAITYGVDYSGAIISDRTHAEGMEQPVIQWTPSIAPCGMAFSQGDAFPRWRGDLFVGALKFTHLRRLELEGDQVVHQEELLRDRSRRIRHVAVGPGGRIHVLTDHADGELWRLEPR